MKNKFTQQQLRIDIESLTQEVGWSITRLARKSGVDQASLSRFCNGTSGLSGGNIEKLWPYIYGARRPEPPEEAA